MIVPASKEVLGRVTTAIIVIITVLAERGQGEAARGQGGGWGGAGKVPRTSRNATREGTAPRPDVSILEPNFRV